MKFGPARAMISSKDNLESVWSFRRSGAIGFDGVPEGPECMARFLGCLVNPDRGNTAANNSYALAA